MARGWLSSRAIRSCSAVNRMGARARVARQKRRWGRGSWVFMVGGVCDGMRQPKNRVWGVFRLPCLIKDNLLKHFLWF